jgi:hypothetical protein
MMSSDRQWSERAAMRAVRRLAPAVLLGTAIAVLWQTAGGPDIGSLKPLFQGSRFDSATGLALSELVIWSCLLAVAGYAAIAGTLGAARAAMRNRFTLRGTTLVALVGLAFLIAGLARHASQSVTVCCGSLQEARAALGR